MPVTPGRPHVSDPPDVLYERACRYFDLAEEKVAVIQRVKDGLSVWLQDKRMKILARVLLDDIERIEREEAERRRAPPG